MNGKKRGLLNQKFKPVFVNIALTHFHIDCMVFHMKTTLIINDDILIKLKEEAARRKTTISELVESALRLMLDTNKSTKKDLKPLPTFDLEGSYVDISNREELYKAMKDI